VCLIRKRKRRSGSRQSGEEEGEKSARERERTVFTSLKSANSGSGISFLFPPTASSL